MPTVAGLSPIAKRRLGAAGFFVLLAAGIGAAVAGGTLILFHMAEPKVTFEMAVMESLAEHPADYPTFVREVESRVELNEGQRWYLENPLITDPDKASRYAAAYEIETTASPVVWYHGRGVGDVLKCYSLQFGGTGGFFGGGAGTGHFMIFVGAREEFVGWQTYNPEWRAKVLELSGP